jgi:hypothetical protein
VITPFTSKTVTRTRWPGCSTNAETSGRRHRADVAEEALEHLADGPTWICGGANPAGGSPLGTLSRRDAVLAMSRGASARSQESVKH